MISTYEIPVSYIPDECLDDYLLMLILIDTIAMADRARGDAAESIVERLIPRFFYDLVMDRYDELTGDFDDERNLLATCFRSAAHRPSNWKAGLVAHLLDVVAVDGAVDAAALAEVADLARAIDADRELARVCALSLS